MYKFHKKEKLCNRDEIKNLFVQGQSFLIYPFSVRYTTKPNLISPKVQVLLLSPKRYQKLSVNRNRAKRLMRESYRLNKESIIQFSKIQACDITIAISLVSNKIPLYVIVEQTMINIIDRIIQNTQNHIESHTQTNK